MNLVAADVGPLHLDLGRVRAGSRRLRRFRGSKRGNPFRRILTLNLLALALTVSFVASSEAGLNGLEGQVKDADGQALNGIEIVFTPKSGQGEEKKVTTATAGGAGGRFAIGGGFDYRNDNMAIAGHTFAVTYTARSGGWWFWAWKWDVAAIEIRTGPISGRVALGGRGVEGVAVTSDFGRSGTTDAEGHYTLSNISGPPTAVRVTMSGFTFSPVSRSAAPGRNDIDFQLTTGPLSGRVTRYGAGWPDVPVEIRRPDNTLVTTVKTDGTGGFLALGLSGTYGYSVQPVLAAYGFTPYEEPATSVGRMDLEFELKSGPIRGRVVNGMAPVGQQVTIVARRNGNTVRTVQTVNDGSARQGSFEFTDLPAATYSLEPTPVSGLNLPASLVVQPGETNVIIDTGFRVTGRVTSFTADGDGVPGVTIEARTPDQTLAGQTTTDQSGRYTLSGLAPQANYFIAATNAGMEFPESPLAITLDGPREDQDFTARALIQGRVTLFGAGLKEVRLASTSQDGLPTGIATTDTAGHFRLAYAVDAPQMTIRASLDGFQFTPDTRSARPGVTATNVDFEATGGVMGRITFADGSAASGITVHARTNQNPIFPSEKTSTDAQGLYLFTQFSQGTAIVEPAQAGFAFDPVSATASAGATSVDFKVTQSPPFISPINDQNLAVNRTSEAILFVVGDRESTPDALTLSIDSDTPSLIHPTNVVISGTGSDRTMTIRPAPEQSGRAMITLRVADPNGSSAESVFSVAVGEEPMYRLFDFDVGLPAGFDHGVPKAINEEGLAVGHAYGRYEPPPGVTGFLGYKHRPVIYSPASGTLNAPSIPGYSESVGFGAPADDVRFDFNSAHAVNRVGQVVGCVVTTNNIWKPFVWEQGAATTLGGPGRSWATAINDAGQVAVGANADSFSLWEKQGDGWVERQVVPVSTEPSDYVYPAAINEAGDVVGKFGQWGTWQGFIWQDETLTLLTNHLPLDINEHGQVLVFDPSGQSLSRWGSGSLTPLVDQVIGTTFRLNDLGQVVGSRIGTNGVQAFLISAGDVFELGPCLSPPRPEWNLEAASAINNRGDLVGVATLRTNGQKRGWIARPVIPVGQAVPRPVEARGSTRQPSFAQMVLLDAPPGARPENYFLWTEFEKKLYAIQPVTARISWPVSDDVLNTNFVVTSVITDWPRNPQIHVVGAPVEVEPPGVASFPYRFFAVVSTTAGVTNVDPATKIFHAARSGYSVLQYYETGGGQLDPLHQRVFLRVVQSARWDDARFAIPQGRTACEIGQPIRPRNASARAVYTFTGSDNDFEIVAKSPGAQYNSVAVTFRENTNPGPAVVARYTNNTLTVWVPATGLTSSNVLEAVNDLSNCPFAARPANGEGSAGNLPSGLWSLPAQVTDGGDLEHDDYSGRNGFVLFTSAFYDGHGPDRAYDRATRQGTILPVNRLESGTRQLAGDETNQLVVVWYHRDNVGVAWPDRPISYEPRWPTNAEKIIISSQKDAPVRDPLMYPDKRIYHQPDWHAPGFNPNEEHAAIFEDKVTALRDDWNGPPPRGLGFSQAFTLLKYRSPFTGEWQMKVFAVTNSDPEHPFRYPQQVAQEIQPPYPLNLLTLCPQTQELEGPLWRDYKNKIYAYAAGPGLSRTNAVIRYFYPLQGGYFYDLDRDGANDLPVGTCIPWLAGWSRTGQEPLDVNYDVRWPDSIPTLRMGSTLAAARDGLPEIFGQARAEVLFEGVNPVYTVNGQRTLPPGYAENSGVRLYDPLSERSVGLPSGFLLPSGVETVIEALSGRKLFPALPYHLRCRFLYDELDQRLIFRGFTIYKEQPPSDPLLLPNVMTAAERDLIIALLPNHTTWSTKVGELHSLTRNPNRIDVDGKPGPDPDLLVGLTTNATGELIPEPLGDGAKALSAALPLTQAAADLLTIPGPEVALRFNGSPAGLVSSNMVGLPTGATDHSIEAWVRVDDYPTGTDKAWVLALGAESAVPQHWILDSGGILRLGGPLGTLCSVTVPMERGQWVHLESSWDGVTYRVFTNGLPAGVSTNCAFDLQGIPLMLALPMAGHTTHFRGAIDEVRLWNKARSERDISRYLHLSLRGNEVGLVAYWRLDEDVGTQCQDASGYGNTGRFVGGPDWSPTGADLVRKLNGYVTLAFNNDPGLPGLPVTLTVIQMDPSLGLDEGDLRVIASDNIFDERLTLRQSGDFGFVPEEFEFEWYYHPGGESHPLPQTESDIADLGWLTGPRGANLNYITLGQGGESGVLVISDNRWILRYRPVLGTAMARVMGTGWSEWAGAPNRVPKEAMLSEGWVKRVTQALNPFDARTDDFRNSEVNTFASLLVSAGRRYEGDIAFNPDADNVNKVGLIEAYQTVLNRARGLSIDANIEFSPANEALLHAASKIADLYLLLGNEAYADAEDPTIGFTTPDGEVGTLAPSIFAFQNQLDSLLEEELVLLRGLDQNLGRPVYNRLPWNFTHGDGQVAYQQVYNIVDTQTHDPLTGSIILPDGFIDANDAATLYPQGHGDAWGHYLTAVGNYYTLLLHTNFNWQPRTEHVLLAGVPIEVDYEDERRFANIAAAKARTGSEIVNLTYRLNYVDDPAGQWQGYKDTHPDRAWGVDEWARRAGQGSYFDWVVANAILPAEDPNPDHQGIEKIDRTTVPELREITSEHLAIQSQIDSADVGLNPLGLAKGAIPFDLDPAFLVIGSGIQGEVHFDQVYQRALKAMENAATVFNHANDITKNLRRTQDSAADFAQNVEDQEGDFQNRLIELFGYPYSGDIGPGKVYASGYNGPDLLYFNYVDESELTGEVTPGPSSQVDGYFKSVELQLTKLPNTTASSNLTLRVPYVLSDAPWRFTVPAGSRGTRRAPGEIQNAISDLLQTYAAYRKALAEYGDLLAGIESGYQLLIAKYGVNSNKVAILNTQKNTIMGMNAAIGTLKGVQVGLKRVNETFTETQDSILDGTPKFTIAGMAVGGDFAAPLHGALRVGFHLLRLVFAISADVAEVAQTAVELDKERVGKQTEIDLLVEDQRYEVQQQAAELRAKIRSETSQRIGLFTLKENLAQQMGNYRAKLAEGLRLLEERDGFRRRVAGAVSENRYRDMTFRVFRNDAIQKYRAQFDLAAKYVYLAATAYDYETTMLGSQTGSGRQFLTSIVRQRALGEWVDGQPIVGRHGLADTLGRLSANWDILKTQLGINNPEHEDGYFSLRSELFRRHPSGFTNENFNMGLLAPEESWHQVLQRHVIPNLWDVPEFRRYCRPFAPESAGPQPGLVIPFSTTINFGLNFFGWPLGAGDGAYDSSRFATKIWFTGILFEDYPLSALSRTPRVYLVPVGTDFLRVASGLDTTTTREFRVVDQRIPVPFPIGHSDVSSPAFIPTQDSLSGSFIEIRRHASFHAYTGPSEAFDPMNDALTESRLIGRSVWNTRWLLIVPGGTFLFDPEEGLDTFIDSISDITVYFRTYSFGGN